MTQHRDVTAAEVYAESAARASRLSPVDLYRQEVHPRLTVEDVYGGVIWKQRRGVQWRGACPLHGGKAPSFVVNVETLAWWCHSKCQTGGGPIEYINGGEKARGDDYRRIVDELAARVGVGSDAPRPAVPAHRCAPTPERPYPPAAEVELLLSQSKPVTTDAACVESLISRGVDPRTAEERDVVRALPEVADVSGWARFRPGYRLLVTVYGRFGEPLSVRARSLGKRDPKVLTPDGYRSTGLVMADALGLHLLRTGSRPSWWTTDAPPLHVIIVEGEPDFWTAACEASDANEHAPAILGVVQGSWGAEFAARIPDGAHVIVATDWDDPGHKYAAQIVESFEGRDVKLSRWRPRDVDRGAAA